MDSMPSLLLLITYRALLKDVVSSSATTQFNFSIFLVTWAQPRGNQAFSFPRVQLAHAVVRPRWIDFWRNLHKAFEEAAISSVGGIALGLGTHAYTCIRIRKVKGVTEAIESVGAIDSVEFGSIV